MEALHDKEMSRIIHTDEVIFDGQTEQGVELDYVLPDYYPDIFKILKCCLTPRIVAYSVSGDSKLMLDGVVYIKVLYLAEGSGAVHCIDQRYTYSKVLDMARKGSVEAISPQITLIPKADYCNCRAVSSRRIDVRGAVSCKVKATGCISCTLPEIPSGLQVKSRQMNSCGKSLTAEKQLTVREEIDTGAAGIGFIMQSSATPKVTDVRVIADKAVIKGMVNVSALYGLASKESAGCTEMENMSADIPVSVIMDIDGITDTHRCMPQLNVMNCELQSSTDSGLISCELLLQCRMRACMDQTVTIPTDVYSTEYETDFTAAHIRIGTEQRLVNSQLNAKSVLSCDSGEIQTVWNCRSEIVSLTCRPANDHELMLTGQLCCQAMGKTTEGIPFFIEKQEVLEQAIVAENLSNEVFVDYSAAVSDTSYSINHEGRLELNTIIDFSGCVNNIVPIEAVNTVTIHEDKPKEKDCGCALKIFYTDSDSRSYDCWSIAKRYNTTVEAVMRENEIDDEKAELSGMILIPTV